MGDAGGARRARDAIALRARSRSASADVSGRAAAGVVGAHVARGPRATSRAVGRPARRSLWRWGAQRMVWSAALRGGGQGVPPLAVSTTRAGLPYAPQRVEAARTDQRLWLHKLRMQLELRRQAWHSCARGRCEGLAFWHETPACGRLNLVRNLVDHALAFWHKTPAYGTLPDFCPNI